MAKERVNCLTRVQNENAGVLDFWKKIGTRRCPARVESSETRGEGESLPALKRAARRTSLGRKAGFYFDLKEFKTLESVGKEFDN